MGWIAPVVLLWMGIVTCKAFQSYKSDIPNGSSVPDTCSLSGMGDIWRGVGHKTVKGGGAVNNFGSDFALADHTWTVDLCNKDSDGDGVSNGEELGDPNCVWATGQTPAGMANSHPGICEPVNSENCKQLNTWVSSCPAATLKVNNSTSSPTPTPTTPTLITTTTATAAEASTKAIVDGNTTRVPVAETSPQGFTSAASSTKQEANQSNSFESLDNGARNSCHAVWKSVGLGLLLMVATKFV